MRRRITAFTVAALLTGAVGVSAQIYAPESLARDFRLEWEVTRGRKGPKVEGYVYNQAMRTADRMRLQIERLDASGKVVGSSTVWVFGTVRPDGRAYFSASVPEAASFRSIGRRRLFTRSGFARSPAAVRWSSRPVAPLGS